MWWVRDGEGAAAGGSWARRGERGAGCVLWHYRPPAPVPPGRQDAAPSSGCRCKPGEGVQTWGRDLGQSEREPGAATTAFAGVEPTPPV